MEYCILNRAGTARDVADLCGYDEIDDYLDDAGIISADELVGYWFPTTDVALEVPKQATYGVISPVSITAANRVFTVEGYWGWVLGDEAWVTEEEFERITQ